MYKNFCHDSTIKIIQNEKKLYKIQQSLNTHN